MPAQQNIWIWDGTAWVKASGTSEGHIFTTPGYHDLVQVRHTAVGLVYTGAAHLHWITLNPSGPNAFVGLSDDLDGLGAVAWEYFIGVRKGEQIPFPVPFKFATGIYIQTFTAMTSVIFGYHAL